MPGVVHKLFWTLSRRAKIRTCLDIMHPNLGTKIEKKMTPVMSEDRTFQEGNTIWTRDYMGSTEKCVDGITSIRSLHVNLQ